MLGLPRSRALLIDKLSIKICVYYMYQLKLCVFDEIHTAGV